MYTVGFISIITKQPTRVPYVLQWRQQVRDLKILLVLNTYLQNEYVTKMIILFQ